MKKIPSIAHSQKEHVERLLLHKQLVQLYNHHNSSCIHRQISQNILINITFIVHHAQLRNASLQKRYIDGILQLQTLCKESEEILHKVQDYEVLYPNERLHYLLDTYFPTYLKQCLSPYAPFHYAFVDEDLDYPLLDGLPLQHHMYHLQGIDLVHFYLQQLSIEVSFLRLFAQDLPVFYKAYEKQRHISLFELNENIVQMLLPQVLLHVYIKKRLGILLDAHALTQLRYDLSKKGCKQCAMQMFNQLRAFLNEEVYTYVNTAYPDFLQQLYLFYEQDVPLFIYEENTLDHFMLTPVTSCSNQTFLSHLDKIRNMISPLEKAQYFHEHFHSEEDIVDALTCEYFDSIEVALIFKQYTWMELAVFLRCHYPETFAFGTHVTLIELIHQPQSAEWEKGLYETLQGFTDIQRQSIERMMNQLQIKS